MRIRLTLESLKTHCRKLFILPLTLLLLVFGGVASATEEESTGPFLVLIGAPGAGKTTNGEYISEKYGVPSIEVRKVVQDEIAKAATAKPRGSKRPGSRRYNAWSERNRQLNAAMKKLEKGELVSDEVINSSVLARLLESDAMNGFVLDGYPASVEQAVYLEALLMTRGVESLQVILLDVSDEIALARMAERGRADDKSGFAEQRLSMFRTDIGPVLEYYQDYGLSVVDASKDLTAIQAELDSILEK